jgi:hypothetical protein
VGATIATLVATWGVSSLWLLPGGLGSLPALPRGISLLLSPGSLSLLLLFNLDRSPGSVGLGIGSSYYVSNAFWELGIALDRRGPCVWFRGVLVAL